MENLRIYVEVPVVSFRVSYAREFWETYFCPPPATVYGMLLSAIGEENRLVHVGAELAISIICKPELSVVFRSFWRVKDIKKGPGIGSNKRPDFQELLTGLKMFVFVRKGENEIATVPLAERLRNALDNPSSIKRFGGLSLGESTHLVNEFKELNDAEVNTFVKTDVLVNDEKGDLSLPIWVDHVGSIETKWGQFKFVDNDEISNVPEKAWITIKSA